MPFQRPTLKTITDRMVADVTARMGSQATRLRRSWVEIFSRVLSGSVHLLYGYIAWGIDQMFADTAEDEALARKAAIYGIYRNPPQVASGSIHLKGNAGLSVEAGTVFSRSDAWRFETVTTVELSGSEPTTTVEVRSLLAGMNGNTEPGTILKIESPLFGLDEEATVDTLDPIAFGADREDLESLRSRYLERVQNPPQGGAKSDYFIWAREVPNVGTVRVYGPDDISLVQDGNPGPITPPVGEVWVYFSEANLDTTPSADRVKQVKDHIKTRMPVTATVQVFGLKKVPLAFNIIAEPSRGFTRNQMREDITAALQDLVERVAKPGGTIYLSQIDETISRSASEAFHTLVLPTENIVFSHDEIGSLVKPVTINPYT